jgi:RNA polymerase sigma factor (sigma-70 family)
MIPGSTRPAAKQLEALFRLGAIGGLTDAQLLERFLSHRGEDAEAAFTAVVERHGPMVLRVCRRILADPNDAEDAFQVTFLVLARKARAIARRALLANWLYGVAVRSAREVRKNAARRRAREEPMTNMQRAESPPAEDSAELRFVIDEELSRLSDSFRAPVVLCDLEGKTHKEAARILGVPVGTVSSRLVRARGLLRSRLARRGFDPSAAEPPRDATPLAVPPALIAATSRAAIRLVAGAPIAGAVSAHLAKITGGVLKTMLIAKMTSKGIIVATVLCLSLGATAIGVVSHVLLGADPEPFAFARSDDREWAWLDRLQNADEATRERLKRCASSATSNFASLHRLTFDYDLTREIWRQPLDAAGKVTGVDREFSRGTVYWKEGTVRYDHYPLGTFHPNGRKSLYKRPRIFSAVRSRDMLAYTENNPNWGLMLSVDKPPTSTEDWELQHPFAPMPHLDPWLHYAGPFCQDRAKMRDFLEHCRAIESEEAGGKVLLRFLRADGGGRVEVTCEQAADWLPVGLRAGEVQQGQWKVFVELSNEWQKLSGVWYPAHQVKVSYIGIDMTAVKEIDLTVRNLRANGVVNLPDSTFSLSAMAIPDGTHGLDKRKEPPRSLIRTGGVVRDQRPGEGPSMRNTDQEKAEREKDAETIPAVESATRATTAPAPKVSVASQAYLSLLEEYDPQHRAREKAVLDAKTESKRRETYLALARLDWDYAPRFMELARQYPDDPVAIDALAWLVANVFEPPGSQQAADILIHDHLASDKMIAIYRQLAMTLDPAPASAGERLLRAAVQTSPTAAARGLACLKLADLLRYRANTVRNLRGPEPEPLLRLSALARGGGREPVKRPDEDPDALTREAERFYDLVVQRYSDIPGQDGKLGEPAAQALFQLRDLAVGRPAPEVQGPDVDGKPLRLGDYRGQVVVLIFAGGLSVYNRDLCAQGRALSQRLKGRPFAVLSVHLDDSKETVTQSIKAGEITWRCLWEGLEKRPNCDRWHAQFIPSVYVIDANGIIRAKEVKGKALDQAVDALMAKLDRPAAAGSGSNP